MASTASTIHIAHSAHGAANSPFSIAVEGGYFADEGLDVRRDEVTNVDIAIDRLMKGELQVCGSAGGAILNVALRGGDPLVVMSLEAENVFAIIGARDVQGPEDLRGRVVVISKMGGGDHVIMLRALRDWGLDPEHDVTMKELGSRAVMWEAVTAGEAAAMPSTIPQPILARSVGLPVLRDFADEHEPYQLGAVVTTRRFADARPDDLRAFVRAMRRAFTTFQTDLPTALAHMKARSKLDDVEVLTETHRIFAAAMEHACPNPQALANVARDYAAQTDRDVDIDVSTLVDPSYYLEGA